MNATRPDPRTDALGFAKRVLTCMSWSTKLEERRMQGDLLIEWNVDHLHAGYRLNLSGTMFEIKDRDTEEKVTVVAHKGFREHATYRSAADMLELVDAIPLPEGPSEAMRESASIAAGLAVHHLSGMGATIGPDMRVLIVRPLRADRRTEVHLMDRHGIVEDTVASPRLKSHAALTPPRPTTTIGMPDKGWNRARERIIDVGDETIRLPLAGIGPLEVMKALAKAPAGAEWIRPEWAEDAAT